VKHALPELSKHRGLKQLLFDILNCILFILCIGKLAFTAGHTLRFFKVQTDSENIVKAIEAELKDPGNQAQPGA